MSSEGPAWAGDTTPATVGGAGAARGTAPRLLRDHALETLRNAIVEGRLRPGQRLTERELCQSLGISRTVVREIVRQLEAERLVEVAAHRGLRVATLSPRAVREIYEVRTELEVLLVRAFIAAATPEDIKRLRAIHQDFMAVAGRADLADIVSVMGRYFGLIMAVGNHTVAADLLGRLLARINQLRVLAITAPGRMDDSVAEFGRMVEEIAARNADGAEAALRTYLRGAARAAMAQAEAAAEQD
jgi:DNA-binding GntR family transcriptional regulator